MSARARANATSRNAWTNLHKVSPDGWNPGADLLREQRAHAAALLRRELEERALQRVLALTGGWITPFGDALDLRVDRRDGLVEGAGTIAGVPCAVARHPMGNPVDRMVHEVRAAFAGLGGPLQP